MDYKKYFEDLPTELGVTGITPELKLLKLYAYNAFYSADSTHTQDCNDGITFHRVNNYGIDGVFLNTSLDDNTIEIIYSYWVNDGEEFDFQRALSAISHMCSSLTEISRRHFSGNNQLAETLISDYLEESESKAVLLRVITNYVPTPQEKQTWSKTVASYNVSVKFLKVEASIAFGKDIEETVEANIAPFDYVEKDKLVIDTANNILRYDDNSFICNVSAKSLKELWEREGGRGLLAMNLRYYIKSKNIDEKIAESIVANSQNFWYLNNGIIIVCDEYAFVNNELRLSHFSIVNGGQTTRMIGETDLTRDFSIACKVIRNRFETSIEKNQFIADVAEATNTQKPIKAKDIIANKVEQRNLKSMMQDNKVYVEIKRGDHYDHSIYVEPWQRTKNNELAQDLYSFVFMEPGPARNSVSNILQNEDKYYKIFVNHQYSFSFLKSVLFLEKAYREYAKAVANDVNENPIKQGLVKNGLFYAMGTMGYLLKLLYNPEFKTRMVRYRNAEKQYDKYSSELAFDHAFIPNEISYKQFKIMSFDFFNYIFDKLITKEFEIARDRNPVLAYSNWMKSNTGFNAIRTRINEMVFDRKDESALEYLKKYFLVASEEQVNENGRKYLALFPNGGNSGDDPDHLVGPDEALRNELMLYRSKYAMSKHKSDTSIFSDVVLMKLVVEKPTDKESLFKIITVPATQYYCGDAILDIIRKY